MNKNKKAASFERGFFNLIWLIFYLPLAEDGLGIALFTAAWPPAAGWAAEVPAAAVAVGGTINVIILFDSEVVGVKLPSLVL